MKKCKRCKQMRPIHRYYLSHRGNPINICAYCKTLESRRRYQALHKDKRKEKLREEAVIRASEQLALRPEKKIKRDCSVFPGYLFAGDL